MLTWRAAQRAASASMSWSGDKPNYTCERRAMRFVAWSSTKVPTAHCMVSDYRQPRLGRGYTRRVGTSAIWSLSGRSGTLCGQCVSGAIDAHRKSRLEFPTAAYRCPTSRLAAREGCVYASPLAATASRLCKQSDTLVTRRCPNRAWPGLLRTRPSNLARCILVLDVRRDSLRRSIRNWRRG
jgi:hypothetical protein